MSENEPQPRKWEVGEICEHGSLGRKCETCELIHEEAVTAFLRSSLAAVTAERDEMRRQRNELLLRLPPGPGGCGVHRVRVPDCERCNPALSTPPAAGEGGGT